MKKAKHSTSRSDSAASKEHKKRNKKHKKSSKELADDGDEFSGADVIEDCTAQEVKTPKRHEDSTEEFQMKDRKKHKKSSKNKPGDDVDDKRLKKSGDVTIDDMEGENRGKKKRKKSDKTGDADGSTTSMEIMAEEDHPGKKKRKKAHRDKFDDAGSSTAKDAHLRDENSPIETNKPHMEEKQKKSAGDVEIKDSEADDNVTGTSSDPDSSVASKQKKKDKKKRKKSDKEKSGNGETVTSKDSVDTMCLDYIRTWKRNRDQWSFRKVRQVWLLQNMFNLDKVPDEDFELMLEYMEDLKGKARQLTIENAEKLLSASESEEEGSKGEKLSEAQCDRVRQVVQLLA